MLNFLKKHIFYLIITSVFLLIFSIISFVNHYYFRTYAWDLGIYTNSLYDYSRFKWHDGALIDSFYGNFLSDHFDFYPIIFSPFSYLFGTYTLLIIQIFFILIGSLGLYKFTFLKTSNVKFSNLAILHYFLFFGIYSALSFDYHSNVIAACSLTWFFYFLEKKNLLKALFIFLWILLAKETMALWMCFISLVAAIEYRKILQYKITFSILSILSLIWFFVIVRVIIPSISYTQDYHHFNYHILGNNFSDAIFSILKNPITTLKYLYTNTTSDSNLNGIKLETWRFIIYSGIFVLILRPWFLIGFIPLIFIKMLNDNPTIWSIDAHYNIEFLPLLTIGVVCVVNSLYSNFLKKIIYLLVLLGTFSCTFKYFDGTVYWHPYDRVRFYQKEHYSQNFDIQMAHQLLNLIPKNAVVSTQSVFVPHLALRDKIYQFPVMKDDTEIIFLNKKAGTYPIDDKEFDKMLFEIQSNPIWKSKFAKDGFYIFEKVKN